mgnify:CR=1 FL=1
MWLFTIFFGTRHQAARNITHIGELNKMVKSEQGSAETP